MSSQAVKICPFKLIGADPDSAQSLLCEGDACGLWFISYETQEQGCSFYMQAHFREVELINKNDAKRFKT